MTTTYTNPWHHPGKPDYGPAQYETTALPLHYRGFLIYHRIPGSPGYGVWDIVKDGACICQYAGPHGARRAIDALLDTVTETR